MAWLTACHRKVQLILCRFPRLHIMFALCNEMGWKSVMRRFLAGVQPCTFERALDCQPGFSFPLLLLPLTKVVFSEKENGFLGQGKPLVMGKGE